jgi:hypothetical protein
MKETHQVLRQLLIEKEAAVKRLEKEIESIHVVLGLLGDTELLGVVSYANVNASAPAPQPMHSEMEPSGRAVSTPPSQNRVPPSTAPFSASASNSQSSPAVEGRAAATRNWP